MTDKKDFNMPTLCVPEGETLLEFPCEFPIKAMGLACDELEVAVLDIVHRHVPDLGEGALRLRPSRNGKYVSITVTIIATSKDQLDAIYMDLTACEYVNYAL